MSENEENTEIKKTTKNKKGLKIALLTLLIVIVIAGASVGGYFAYQHYRENKSTGTEWGDIYYNYITNEQPIEETNKISYLQDAEIGFVQINEHSNPLMIATGKKDEGDTTWNYAMIYEIDENKNVTKPTKIGTTANLNVEFLYDVQKKKYDYFINTSNENSSTYTSVDTALKDQKKYSEIEQKLTNGKNPTDLTVDDISVISKEYEEYKKNDTTRTEYTVSKEEKTVTQNTLSGETISYDKLSEYVIDSGVEEKTFSYSKDMKKADIRNNIESEVKDYKTIEETVTEDIKTEVEKRVEEVETKKQQIETAKAEIKAEEERKAAEEAAKKAAEEAALGLKVGKYRLKYGTYKLDNDMGMGLSGTIVLKQGGTFHIKANFNQGSGQTEKYDEDGTYTVGREYNSYDLQDAIKFKTKSGRSFSFFVVQNNKMNSQWLIYKYTGK